MCKKQGNNITRIKLFQSAEQLLHHLSNQVVVDYFYEVIPATPVWHNVLITVSYVAIGRGKKDNLLFNWSFLVWRDECGDIIVCILYDVYDALCKHLQCQQLLIWTLKLQHY